MFASKVNGNDATHIEDDNVTVFRACVLFVHLIFREYSKNVGSYVTVLLYHHEIRHNY